MARAYSKSYTRKSLILSKRTNSKNSYKEVIMKGDSGIVIKNMTHHEKELYILKKKKLRNKVR